jgi:1-deoxy-D-xylulose-5-phosphate reductoisomerase
MSASGEAVRVAVAGSSGSIGTQTLDVIRAESGAYQVVSLAVGSAADLLIDQIREFRPEVVVVTDPTARADVAERLGSAAMRAEGLGSVEVSGDLADLVHTADVVINGVVGFAGLDVTVATLRAGRRLGLANKESLIAAGPVVQPLRQIPGAEILPVDSEHCAIHQCLRSSRYSSGKQDKQDKQGSEVARLVLTASGGPFRGRSAAELAAVTVADALAHPTWSMGPKISVDSSTLMNKGLEVIEAHELFGVDYAQIDVVVHPQSVIHSMVEFHDGSTIAQLSMPDMRLPIGYALGYPDRISTPFGRIDWAQLARLDFELPDLTTFSSLAVAYQAGRIGGTAPAWLSAANEVAVEAFLAGRIRWNQIAGICVDTLERHDGHLPTSIDDVIAADALARVMASQVLASLK